MWLRRTLLSALAVAAALSGGPAAQSRSVVEWLDAYAGERFDDVTRALANASDFGESGLR